MNQDLNNLKFLNNLCTKSTSVISMFHMHASRSGPLLANEIYLARKEKEQNPNLLLIRGLQQPHGTVSKFLGYWLSGLDSLTVNNILSRLFIGNTFIYKNGFFDKNILNSKADEVECEWSSVADALVSPLFLVSNNELSRCGFNIEDFNNLKKIKEGVLMSLEEAFTGISVFLINTLLKKQNLPMYEIIRFNPHNTDGLKLKYVCRDILDKEYDYLIEKKQKHYESYYNTVIKLLKSYNGVFPYGQKLSKVIERSNRIDPSFKLLSMDLKELEFRFNNPHEKRLIKLSYMEQITLSQIAYNRAICDFPLGSNNFYIDGKNMVRVMFSLADLNEECLVLQEFIRGTDYDLYKQLIGFYPNLEFKLSSCRIWDIKDFPEFDKNFITGLKYLN